jgi:hypothetical protein
MPYRFTPHTILLWIILLLTLAGCGLLEREVEKTAGAAAETQPLVNAIENTGAAISSATPPVTVTPALNDDPMPTPAPTNAPQPTLIFTPTTIPNWKQINGQGVSLWLPATWMGGSVQEGAQALLTLGPGYGQYTSQIEANADAILLWAFDANILDGAHITNVTIGSERMPREVRVDTYMEALSTKLPSQFRIIEQSSLEIAGREAGSLLILVETGGVIVKEIMYIIKEGGTLWLITYAASDIEFETHLPVFELSINTFAVNQP